MMPSGQNDAHFQFCRTFPVFSSFYASLWLKMTKLLACAYSEKQTSCVRTQNNWRPSFSPAPVLLPLPIVTDQAEEITIESKGQAK